MTPSNNITNTGIEKDLIFSNLLKEPDFKVNFSKLMKQTKKYYQTSGTISFLRECLELDIIPNTFRIRNEPLPGTSRNHHERWSQGSKNASKVWMESSLLELDETQVIKKRDIEQLKSEILIRLTGEEQIIVESHYVNKARFYWDFSKNIKDNKLKNLQSKPVHETTPQLTESRNITKKRNRPGIRERKQKKIVRNLAKKSPISVIFNYSSLELTDAMSNLLNRGLNFSIKPLSLNLADVLTDFKRFERKMKWREFFFGEETQDYKPPLFKVEKTNLPKNHPTPRPLQTFLNTVESNIQDKSLWNKKLLNPKQMNIPQCEFEALQELIKLQREKVIIIKPADKGAGILVMDYNDYIVSCNDHLSSVQPVDANPSPLPVQISNQPPQNTPPTPLPYYNRATEADLKKVKKTIKAKLDEGSQNGWISKEEFTAMNPTTAGPGKFYQIFKVHKPHSPPSLPPGRPIISGNGSVTENISKFVDFHVKDLVKSLPTYIQDTPDFLRNLEDLNQSSPVPDNAILVTIDVCALYTNIQKNDGLLAMQKALELRSDKTIPTDYLIDLLDIILSYNIFEFNNELYCQEVGCAMGSAVAPSYANIMMGMIDDQFKQLAVSSSGSHPIKLLKRFIDDYFMIWTGSVESLTTFLSQINSLHPTLKFTSSFTCPFPCYIPSYIDHDCYCHTSRSIPFLDTQVSIREGKLSTDLYRKPTDRCMYLLPSSCHPAHTTRNIPYSLCYRLVRICSDRKTLLNRLEELKGFLISRNYPRAVIQNAVNRALQLDRTVCLKKVEKKATDRVVFATTYHPALPSFSKILTKSWKVMVKDAEMKMVFPDPPMVAYRQARNTSLRSLLVKTKLPGRAKTRRKKSGMKKCNKPACHTCPFVDETTCVKKSTSGCLFNIHSEVNCDTENVIYYLYCDKASCPSAQYIGETGRKFSIRLKEHLGYIRAKNLDQPTGAHFNQPGHSISNLRAVVLEKCKEVSPTYRKLRESYLINNFKTMLTGLNQKR